MFPDIKMMMHLLINDVLHLLHRGNSYSSKEESWKRTRQAEWFLGGTQLLKIPQKQEENRNLMPGISLLSHPSFPKVPPLANPIGSQRVRKPGESSLSASTTARSQKEGRESIGRRCYGLCLFQNSSVANMRGLSWGSSIDQQVMRAPSSLMGLWPLYMRLLSVFG